MKMKDLFSDVPCNTGRQNELDLSKAVVIFFLATIHAYVECSTDDQLWSGLPYFFDSVLGGPLAAPMFIFSMGIGLAYTKKNSADEIMRRGLHIGIAGFLLNICRFLIPSLVGYAITHDYNRYIEKLYYLVFGNDILQFAALAMILMSVLIKFNITPWKIWSIALLMNIAAMPLNEIYTDITPLNIFLGHFIGIDNQEETVMSDFPLLIWFLMYATGYVWGVYLKRLKNKDKFYLMISPVCAVVTAVVLPLEYILKFGMMGGPGANVFYHCNTWEMFVCIAVQFAMLGFYHLLSKYIPDKMQEIAFSVSRNVTIVYCIQWTLVWWAADVFIYIMTGSQYMESWKTLLLGLILSFASVVFAEIWRKFKKGLSERRQV